MEKIKVIERNNLFKNCGMQLGQLHFQISGRDELRIHGSVTLEDGKIPSDMFLRVKANICDKNGNILHILEDHSKILFECTSYNTFSLYCYDISRYINLKEVEYIELYPCFVLLTDEE